ncbi:Cupredoxin [Aspergillus pseudoustus]|uniref:Copper-containing nitrite reductase n=1 Tax=Aspergillus pseudoustus TaxID=1810923 RepID=A0ABR4JPW5_9EURO
MLLHLTGTMRTVRVSPRMIQQAAGYYDTTLALRARHNARSLNTSLATLTSPPRIPGSCGHVRRFWSTSTKRHYTYDDTITTLWKRSLAGAALLTSSWFLLYARKPRVFLEGEGANELGIADLSHDGHQDAKAQRLGEGYDSGEKRPSEIRELPKETAILAPAPNIPPPIERDYPVLLQVALETTTKLVQLTTTHKYEQWTFNNTVPGPFIRARVGDTLELSLTNRDETGNPHNIDCHAILGPGGGSALTTVSEGETKTARFKLQCPGLYIYHCAAAPVPVHIANGMYGLLFVQPEEKDSALAPVDREYYVMQSEFYHEPPEKLDDGKPSPVVEFSYPNAIREEPDVVVFNGHEAALTRDTPLKARVDETVRIYFGNAGPNLTSSFHVIGANFNRVYRDADVLSPPAQYLATVSVPPGGSTIVDMAMMVPGTYTMVDHAIFRLEKGAVGYLNVTGDRRPELYQSAEHDPPAPCVGCKLHP